MKWPPKIGQRPERNEIEADDRLHARDNPNPAGGSQGVVARLNARDPGAHIIVAPAQLRAELKCGQEAEMETDDDDAQKSRPFRQDRFVGRLRLVGPAVPKEAVFGPDDLNFHAFRSRHLLSQGSIPWQRHGNRVNDEHARQQVEKDQDQRPSGRHAPIRGKDKKRLAQHLARTEPHLLCHVEDARGDEINLTRLDEFALLFGIQNLAFLPP